MRIAEENWKVLASFFPAGWQQMAWQSSAVEQLGEWRVVFDGQGSAFAGRLCAVRKSDCAIQRAQRRLQCKASKKQMVTRPGTLEFAKYVIVFTTRSSGSTADALRSYRMRWQIELVFKRLRSLANWGRCPSMTTAVLALGFMGNCLSRSWHKN